MHRSCCNFIVRFHAVPLQTGAAGTGFVLAPAAVFGRFGVHTPIGLLPPLPARHLKPEIGGYS
jgi:hypothetical protein